MARTTRASAAFGPPTFARSCGGAPAYGAATVGGPGPPWGVQRLAARVATICPAAAGRTRSISILTSTDPIVSSIGRASGSAGWPRKMAARRTFAASVRRL
jgi:hypothetical protein